MHSIVDWYDWYRWNIIYSIGEMHLITGTLNISVGYRLSRGAFYSSTGTVGTIGTNGISFITLVFDW